MERRLAAILAADTVGYGIVLPSIQTMKGHPVAEFCCARGRTMRPPRWPGIVPPLTHSLASLSWVNSMQDRKKIAFIPQTGYARGVNPG